MSRYKKSDLRKTRTVFRWERDGMSCPDDKRDEVVGKTTQVLGIMPWALTNNARGACFECSDNWTAKNHTQLRPHLRQHYLDTGHEDFQVTFNVHMERRFLYRDEYYAKADNWWRPVNAEEL